MTGPEPWAAGNQQGSQPGEPGPAAPEGIPDEGWQRLHPLSPILRGGLMILAVGAYVIGQQSNRIFGADSGDDPFLTRPMYAAVAVAVVILGVVVWSWVWWMFARFRIGPTTLELRTGILFRQHRQVRYDRIQAVDVGRPLLARFAGVSEVVVQSAGGSDSQVKLSYLTVARTIEVRDTLMRAAGRSDELVPGAGVTVPSPGPVVGAGPTPANPYGGGVAHVEGEYAGGAPGIRVPNGRLIASLAWHPATFALVPLVPITALAFFVDLGGALPIIGPATVAIAIPVVKRFFGEANFVIRSDGQRLRIGRGLTDLRNATVPVHRIQAIEIRQPLTWRVWGWWRVTVTVAGKSVGAEADSVTSVLLPIGFEPDVLAVLDLARTGVAPGVVSVAMTGGDEGPGLGDGTGANRAPDGGDGFVGSPPASRNIDPISWRRNGFHVTESALVIRAGRLVRRVQIVPHARIQSMRVEQGPLQRSLGLASLWIDTTPGPVSAGVEHLVTHTTLSLLRQQSRRAREARRRIEPEGDRPDEVAARVGSGDGIRDGMPVVASGTEKRWTGADPDEGPDNRGDGE